MTSSVYRTRLRQPQRKMFGRPGSAASSGACRSRGCASVPEVAHAGEDHGQARLVGGGDHLVVAHRAAGLDHRGGAGLGRGQQAVGEGEEGVGGDDRSPARAARSRPAAFAASSAFQAAMRAESTRLICPAPMPTVAPSLA